MKNIEFIHPSELELSASDLEELRIAARMPDEAIDYSDIPPTATTDWSEAVPGHLYRPLKKQITLRIDADILAWVRQTEDRAYQSRLNAILREAMLRDLSAKRKRA